MIQVFLIIFSVWCLIGLIGLYVIDRNSTIPVTKKELFCAVFGPMVWVQVVEELEWFDKPAFRKKND
jgi:hypothetical protein